MKITDEDIEFIEWAYGLINARPPKYPDSNKLKIVYNRVYGVNEGITSCGSCIRNKVLKLKRDLGRVLNDTPDNKGVDKS